MSKPSPIWESISNYIFIALHFALSSFKTLKLSKQTKEVLTDKSEWLKKFFHLYICIISGNVCFIN